MSYLFEVIQSESKSSYNPHKPHKVMCYGPVKSKNEMRALRYAGVIQLLFFLNLDPCMFIDVWFAEDQSMTS